MSRHRWDLETARGELLIYRWSVVACIAVLSAVLACIDALVKDRKRI